MWMRCVNSMRCFETPHVVNQDDSFIKSSPLIINSAESTLAKVKDSPKKITPTVNAPTAPIPVHTVYAVPRGNVFIEIESKIKLVTTVIIVITENPSFVKPSESFIVNAQPTSSRPATNRIIQATYTP